VRTQFVCTQCGEPTFSKLYQTHAGSLFCSRECVSAFRVRTAFEEEAKKRIMLQWKGIDLGEGLAEGTFIQEPKK
jgi:late competence protein required for DNA uptake (superfamily II DNA/RNA helicase)